MDVKERVYEISLNELLSKLKKLNYTSATDRHLESKIGISVHFDYTKNIGVNKDKDQLLITLKYKETIIHTSATLDQVAQTKILDWFYSVSEEFFEKQSLLDEKNEIEGLKLFKEL